MDTYNFTKLGLRGYWYKPSDWKNVEIAGEYHYRRGNGQGITQYVRSEDHSLLHDGCGGSSYKNKIYFNGTSNFNRANSSILLEVYTHKTWLWRSERPLVSF